MIGKLYRWLFDTHRHEWETIAEGDIIGLSTKSIKGKQYILRCKTCGDVRARNLTV